MITIRNTGWSNDLCLITEGITYSHKYIYLIGGCAVGGAGWDQIWRRLPHPGCDSCPLWWLHWVHLSKTPFPLDWLPERPDSGPGGKSGESDEQMTQNVIATHDSTTPHIFDANPQRKPEQWGLTLRWALTDTLSSCAPLFKPKHGEFSS